MPLVIMPATNWTPVISWVVKRLPSCDVAVCAKSAAVIFAGCFGFYGLPSGKVTRYPKLNW